MLDTDQIHTASTGLDCITQLIPISTACNQSIPPVRRVSTDSCWNQTSVSSQPGAYIKMWHGPRHCRPRCPSYRDLSSLTHVGRSLTRSKLYIELRHDVLLKYLGFCISSVGQAKSRMTESSPRGAESIFAVTRVTSPRQYEFNRN
jgi:hypothetical protein